jgi:hypothetical protein
MKRMDILRCRGLSNKNKSQIPKSKCQTNVKVQNSKLFDIGAFGFDLNFEL